MSCLTVSRDSKPPIQKIEFNSYSLHTSNQFTEAGVYYKFPALSEASCQQPYCSTSQTEIHIIILSSA